MTSRRSVVTLVLALIALPAAVSALTPTIDPEELRPGQKAVVRTVFTGQRIEEFAAEIVGVLKGGGAEGDMILARATEDRVIRTGIAQGMSGSPVYVDGRLAGALSGGWSFSREPLFVVTPIREMLGVLDAPGGDPAEMPGTAGPSGLDPEGDAGFASFRWPGTGAHDVHALPAAGPSSPLAAGAPARLPVPIACGGLQSSLLPLAGRLFEPLGFTAVPGGGANADTGATAPFEPGSAVAVELMRGDLHVAAIGTVTWREGNRVLIFGHPLFQAGTVRMPLASASITTVVASNLNSFKLGSAGRPVGTATQDRRAAVAGTIGPPPRLMPLAVTITAPGGASRTFRFESIEDRAMAPQLVSLATLNSLLESGGTGANQTMRWTLVLHRSGAPPLTLSDVAAGDSPLTDLQGGLAAPLRFLYNNPFSKLGLDSITVRLESLPGRNSWSLRSARVLDAAVRPGGVARVSCQMEHWRGAHQTVTLALRVPEEAPPGRYVLWVGGGQEMSRYEATRLPGRYRPSSLEEAWRRLADVRSSDRLHAALLARAPELTLSGHDYPELPTSALALLAGGNTAEDENRRGSYAFLDQVDLRIDGEIHGELQMEVLVDPDAP